MTFSHGLLSALIRNIVHTSVLTISCSSRVRQGRKGRKDPAHSGDANKFVPASRADRILSVLDNDGISRWRRKDIAECDFETYETTYITISRCLFCSQGARKLEISHLSSI